MKNMRIAEVFRPPYLSDLPFHSKPVSELIAIVENMNLPANRYEVRAAQELARRFKHYLAVLEALTHVQG